MNTMEIENVSLMRILIDTHTHDDDVQTINEDVQTQTENAEQMDNSDAVSNSISAEFVPSPLFDSVSKEGLTHH